MQKVILNLKHNKKFQEKLVERNVFNKKKLPETQALKAKVENS